jgi:ankyrin repeat protein
VEGSDRMHLTPLTRAANGGHLEIVRLLLDKGASIGGSDRFPSTPLHAASYNGRLEVTRWLLDRGADMYTRGSLDFSALNLSMQKGSIKGGSAVVGVWC